MNLSHFSPIRDDAYEHRHYWYYKLVRLPWEGWNVSQNAVCGAQALLLVLEMLWQKSLREWATPSLDAVRQHSTIAPPSFPSRRPLLLHSNILTTRMLLLICYAHLMDRLISPFRIPGYNDLYIKYITHTQGDVRTDLMNCSLSWGIGMNFMCVMWPGRMTWSRSLQRHRSRANGLKLALVHSSCPPTYPRVCSVPVKKNEYHPSWV